MDSLRRILARIDGRGYKAYKDIQGSYALGPVGLDIDHVQGDDDVSALIRLPYPPRSLKGENEDEKGDEAKKKIKTSLFRRYRFLHARMI